MTPHIADSLVSDGKYGRLQQVHLAVDCTLQQPLVMEQP